jgi:hypothetical protein
MSRPWGDENCKTRDPPLATGIFVSTSAMAARSKEDKIWAIMVRCRASWNGSGFCSVREVSGKVRLHAAVWLDCMTAVKCCSGEELAVRCLPCVDVCANRLQWTLELRPAWHTNILGYDQNISFDLRPKSWVTNPHAGQGHVYGPHGVCKLHSEPRYACLWK